MTALPRLKARVKVNFPARAEATDGISLTKANGVYTFALDVDSLSETESVSTSTIGNYYFPIYDELNETYTKYPLDALADAVALDFPVSDAAFAIQDDGDATKQVKFQVSGVTTATTRTLTVPDASTTIVGTDATQALTNKTYNGLTVTSTTGTLTIAAGKTATVSNTLTFTGTDASSVAFGTGGTVAYTSNNLSAFAATTSAQLAGVISDETGSGALVFAVSPALTTPDLGTPSAVTLTNGTGLPIATGVSGLGTGVATALAVNVGSAGAPVVNGGALGTPSSGTLTNATGLPISTGVAGLGTGIATALAVNTGAAGAPVLFDGAGGTPSSLTLTNATGLPVSTGVSGLGTGVATFLATPSSANLRGALTDETGTGAAVFATSPTIVTPDITTGFTITSAATSGQYVRGNGTQFVSSAIQAADLPVIPTTSGSTSSAFGAVKVDGTTITASASGVLTAVGGAATDVAVGTTTVSSGTSTYLLYNNAGTLGNIAPIGITKGFRANKNATDQTGIANSTPTLVTFGTADFNTGSYFNTTNSRFTPPAGIVTMGGQIYVESGLTSGSLNAVYIYKNGSLLTQTLFAGRTGNDGGAVFSLTDSANGTDYYEVWVYLVSASTSTIDGGAASTYFMSQTF